MRKSEAADFFLLFSVVGASIELSTVMGSFAMVKLGRAQRSRDRQLWVGVVVVCGLWQNKGFVINCSDGYGIGDGFCGFGFVELAVHELQERS
ncbi:hypothetical protein M0R45_035411 [Rubus argutus]|uniref:Uncharacterized protein n=1 Tax=Rubus argutus TaxID=59490 RepID=A0AAW1VVK2_RUBAR